MRFGRALWLLPPAVALHVVEEAPGFAAWAQRTSSPRYTQRDFVVNNALGLAMTVGATAALARRPGPRAFLAYDSLVLSQQAAWNTVFHVATGAPGVLTAVALFLPSWAVIRRVARREGLLSRRGAAAALAIGGVVHTSAVRQQVYGGRLSLRSA